mgnify:CR=1 FL=1
MTVDEIHRLTEDERSEHGQGWVAFAGWVYNDALRDSYAGTRNYPVSGYYDARGFEVLLSWDTEKFVAF